MNHNFKPNDWVILNQETYKSVLKIFKDANKSKSLFSGAMQIRRLVHRDSKYDGTNHPPDMAEFIYPDWHFLAGTEYYWGLELLEPAVKYHPCSCDLKKLMNLGCRCGGF